MNNYVVISIVALAIMGLGFWYLVTTESSAPTPQSIDMVTPRSADATLIVAFGDSLTAGFGVSRSEAYPAQLERLLLERGYDVAVTNAGVSGETTRGNLERANFIRAQNPDIVILGIGGNDALRALPVDETERNIRATVTTLQSGDQPPTILLLQMQAPLNAGAAYKTAFDALYEDIANEYNLELVPFLTQELFLDNNNKLPDGIHYNQTGYARVTEEHILPQVEDILETSTLE